MPGTRSLPPNQRLEYRIQNAIEIPTEVLCKKPQNKVTVLLKEAIFPAVTSIGFSVGEVLGAVQFYDDTQTVVEEIHFHLTLTIKGDGHRNVQLELVSCLRQSFKTPKEKRFACASSSCHAGDFRG